jgi:phage major head subunit gpT-like protein
MIINVANMADLFRNFNSRFTAGQQRGRLQPGGLDLKYFLKYTELALRVPSTTQSEVHAWLQQIPGFKEWVDERVKKAIAAQAMQVINQDWEDTVSVSRNSLEDDTFGLYSPLFEALGSESSDDAIWLDMVIAALEAGLTGDWIDGKKFFATDRKYSKQTINNYVNAALAKASFMTAWSTMVSYKGPEGNALNVMPTMLLVSPQLFGTAKTLMESEKLSEANVQVDNPCRGLAGVKLHPGLAATSWYLVGEKGGMRGVASQRRREAILTALDRATDPNVFYNKEYVYGADLRGTAFLTFPHLIIKGQ